ncbi:glycoside hydrolase family 2 [Orenia metallireducens]|uniref:Glycoside hydrolase family 2 n=1 Tax=Orenia metallireducens TaxID=1413210 RepID=A0A1C0ADG8_9FIRM|nr:glycoside hydrolase family 2 [Orenia metallireducens]OCL28749.1 glycoside hydrolase family 2 [Orenia metallireducens]
MGEIIKNLNKEWNFKIDPTNIGEEQEWYLNEVDGIKVKIPAPWQTYNNELNSYTGVAWYSNKFSINSDQKRIFIKFNAVDYQTDVWFNSHYLGSHEGGYTPFSFEITDYIKESEDNLLVIKVFDPYNNDEIPRGKQGSWYTRVSGIWQEVELIAYNKSFIKDILITPDVDNQKADFKIELEDLAKLADPKLTITIFSPENKEEKIIEKHFANNEDNHYQVNINNPLLWSPENPWIYNVEVTLKDGTEVIDTYSSYFGMRKVESKDGKIYLNDEPVYIRGALDQGFWPHTIYRAETEEMIKDEIKKTKEMGFNLLRKHIKTEDPRYLYWADHLGLLIWAEAPNYAKWTMQARERFKDEYTKMVTRDYNHPSIIIWSIYNEEWGLEWRLNQDKEKQDWVIDLYDYAKNLDKTRLICDNSGWAHVKTDISDLHRYFSSPDNYKEWERDLDDYVIGDPDANFVDGYSYNGEPLIISEFGIWGLPEPAKIKAKYDGLPTWYKGSAKIFSDDFKIPTTAEKNFTKYGLDKIFSDINELARQTQQREFRGIKNIIEEMRKRSKINGYVVTELTDIEWETNGFLDYFREPKEGYENIPDYNGEIIAMLDIEERNLWSNQEFKGQVYLANDSNQKLSGLLSWQVEETELKGEFKVELQPYSVTKLTEEITFIAPTVDKSKELTLSYKFISNGKLIAKNQEELTITNQLFVKKQNTTIKPVNLSKKLIANLKMNGYQISQDSQLIVSSELNSDLLKELKAGAKVLFLAEEGSKIEEKGFINFTDLPDGESWDRAASFNYINTNYFKELPLNKVSGWELADLYPSYIINNLVDINYKEILAGYFAGWIGNFGATLLETKVGKGSLLVTTFKLAKGYNKQPIATALLNQLVNYLNDN